MSKRHSRRHIKKAATIAQIRSKAKWHLDRLKRGGESMSRLKIRILHFDEEFGEWPVEIFSPVRGPSARGKVVYGTMYFNRKGDLLRKPHTAD